MAKQSAYSQRKKGKKPPNFGRKLILVVELLICGALLAGFGYRFYQYTAESNQFRVETIQIDGLRVLNEEQILLKSGLLNQANVLYLDTDTICAAVEELPYVRSCSLRQVFPDTVILEIEERVGISTLQLNSRSFLIDESGVVLQEYEALELPLMPFISNVTGLEFIEIGQVLEQSQLHGALSVQRVFATLPLSQALTVSEIAALSDNEIVMYCDEIQFELRWSSEDIHEQAQRLNILWDSENGLLSCTEYLDLRFEDNLICK